MAVSIFGSYQSLVSLVQGIWRNKEHQGPVLFTASSIWLSVAQMASGIVIVHYVAPKEMGIWSSVSLALVYSLFVLVGIQNGLSRELPYYLGANNEEMARSLASTTLFYTSIGCILSLVGGTCAVAVLLWERRDSKLIYAVAAMTLMVTFQFYQYYLFLTFRSKNSFLKLAWVQTWQAFIMLFTLPLLFLFHYEGMLLRAVLVAGLALYLMHRVRPIVVRPAWSTASFWLLIKTGLPIFATDYVRTVCGTVDKLVLLKYVGVEQVGLYALAVTAAAAFQVLPQSIAHYVYPRMSHHYGRTNNPRVLWGIAYKVTLVVVVAMIPVALVGYLVLPWAVKALFPKYVAGTHAAQIMLFASVAGGATISSNALSSLKAWSHLIGFQFSYAGLTAVAPFIGIYMFKSQLNGVAYSVLIANMISVILALGFTYAATHSHKTRGDGALVPAPEVPVSPTDIPDEVVSVE
jgi:O-antigen/teichoic acid export membrane protein